MIEDITSRYYTVKKGDTLWGISKHFGYSVEELARLNRLNSRDRHLLKIGQRVYLPEEKNAPVPDLKLNVKIHSLSGKPLKQVPVRLHYDNDTVETTTNEEGWIEQLHINDHLKGLKVEFLNYAKQWQTLTEEKILPLGDRVQLHINTMTEKVKGYTASKVGEMETTLKQLKDDIFKSTPQPSPQSVDGSMPSVPAEPVEKHARVENGQSVHVIAPIFMGDNLLLHPSNEKYRKALVEMGKKHNFPPQAAAAIVNAEAGKVRVKVNGKWKGTPEWDEKSGEGTTKAQGLGQFFDAAWFEYIATEGTLGNQEALKLLGAKSLTAHGGALWKPNPQNAKPKEIKVEGNDLKTILEWRLRGELSIEAILVYANANLDHLKKATGIDATRLPPDEKVKIVYILHHEGPSGFDLLRGQYTNPSKEKKENYKQSFFKKQLIKQKNGNEEWVDAFAKGFNNDYAKAYVYWLLDYASTAVRVQPFMLDSKNFKERDAFEVTQNLCGLFVERPEGKTNTKTAKPAQQKPQTEAKKPSTPQTQAKTDTPKKLPKAQEVSPSTPVGGVPKWNNPLEVCNLRVGGFGDSATNPERAKKKASFLPRGANEGLRPNPHTGIDLAANVGTPVYAVAHGKIVAIAVGKKSGEKGSYGNTIILAVNTNDLPEFQRRKLLKIRGVENEMVDAWQETIYFFYAHLSKINVEKNDYVVSGQTIGSTGDTGNAGGMTRIGFTSANEDGGHLHFEARRSADQGRGKGQQFDPWPLITTVLDHTPENEKFLSNQSTIARPIPSTPSIFDRGL